MEVLQDGPIAAALRCAVCARTSCRVGHTNSLSAFLLKSELLSSYYYVDQTFLF